MKTLNKLDAARRQLLAAIHLQWFLLEPIATYHLAANAAEICDELLKRRSSVRLRQQIRDAHGLSEREVTDMINFPRNFTKHADRDPEAEIYDILPEDADAMVMTACIDYCIASGRSPHSVGIFVAWYAAINPEKTGDFGKAAADVLFPNLVACPRSHQVAAARSVVGRPLSSPILNDKRNELTDNWRWISLRETGGNLRLPV